MVREWEHKVLRRLKVIQNEMWLNKTDCYGPPALSGEYNPFYGKTHSVETRLKMKLKKTQESSNRRK